MRHKAVIGIGSNTPDRAEAVAEAICWLKSVLDDFRASEPYLTNPEPASAVADDYVNAVASGMTSLSADSLTEMLKEYETAHGRSRDMKSHGKVSIDLDLVIYDSEALRPEELSRHYFAFGYDRIR